MKEGLSGHTVIRNCTKYDYGLEEAVASVIGVCDEYVILEAHSEDDTLDRCMALKDKYHPKLRVIRGEWDGGEPKGHEYLRLSRLTNQCIDACTRKFNLNTQADECFHEMGIEAIRQIVEGKTRFGQDVMATGFRVLHFVGNPWTTFPFMYSGMLRMARTDSSWRSAGDACGYKFTNPLDNYVVWMQYPVCFHYGKLGHPFQKLEKQLDMQAMFRSKGFPDPRVLELAERGEGMRYSFLFQDAKDKGLFTPYAGTHPAVMKDWLERHKEWWEIFE